MRPDRVAPGQFIVAVALFAPFPFQLVLFCRMVRQRDELHVSGLLVVEKRPAGRDQKLVISQCLAKRESDSAAGNRYLFAARASRRTNGTQLFRKADSLLKGEQPSPLVQPICAIK